MRRAIVRRFANGVVTFLGEENNPGSVSEPKKIPRAAVTMPDGFRAERNRNS
jgi:hypothetical protein